MAIARCISNTALVSVLAMLAGCTPAPTPANTASASTSAPPAASASATTLSPAEQDLQDAKQAVVKLWQVVDRLTNDPRTTLQDLDTVASGEALEFFRKNLASYRLERLTGSGDSVIEVQAVQAAGNNDQGLAIWKVTACVDASKTKLVDSAGKNVSAPPYRIQHRSVVVQRTQSLLVDQDEVLGTC